MSSSASAGGGGGSSSSSCLHKTRLDTCWHICDGGAWWLYNIFCCPFVLIYNAFVIYFLGCIGVLFHRTFRTICCAPCRGLCPSWYRFKDKQFPADASAILDPQEQPFDDNEFYQAPRAAIEEKMEWMRADELLKEMQRERRGHASAAAAGADQDNEPEHFRLFEDGINPDDIVQGGVGDCWLLAALASLAEYPQAIRHIFVQKEHSGRGKYKLRFWDVGKQQWIHVTVDDFIPVKKGTTTPYFSRPKGNELWVFLIEKAFAKYVGGYAYLDGGRSPWAWHVLTGDNVFSYKLSALKDQWERHIYKFEATTSKKQQRHKMFLRDTYERNDHTRMFELLRQFCRQRAVMAASIHDKARATDGLVSHHAYSLIDAKEVGGYELVQLRNPWSIGEWTGPWSDKSDLWERHPNVARRCKYHERDEFDGTFWMSFSDFYSRFDRIDVCDRSAFRDLHLDVREDQGCPGVVKGCVHGCSTFWCLCRGLRVLYFGHRTSREVEYHAGPCSCMKDTGRSWTVDDVGAAMV
ncbi:hypothetical protein PTSG_07188 [Salpingoeca rosetta]|uniref:Calpain catalytic domain-containing protein n=1 Tax=Salpingoeca rosetta (strain ATCC 50818 / BSB-021) TaxID=946362 RepID=F2UEB3_SALR5|nr:uncharacterized protein PTSG_07188 [Salpingoeca rosetta]EGD74963.1 hypothetical protein PTSG_07188 [Salpingoeca rosetta]|eukprot:XP_004992608.1 hypothetical protein PTSG_07188 [Salpingoeca rosetta]